MITKGLIALEKSRRRRKERGVGSGCAAARTWVRGGKVIVQVVASARCSKMVTRALFDVWGDGWLPWRGNFTDFFCGSEPVDSGCPVLLTWWLGMMAVCVGLNLAALLYLYVTIQYGAAHECISLVLICPMVVTGRNLDINLLNTSCEPARCFGCRRRHMAFTDPALPCTMMAGLPRVMPTAGG